MTTQIQIDASDPDFTLITTMDRAEYLLRFRWNARSEVWTVDVTSAAGIDLVVGRRVRCGVDLIAGAIVRPAGRLFCWPVDNSKPVPLTRESFGSAVGLYYDNGL